MKYFYVFLLVLVVTVFHACGRKNIVRKYYVIESPELFDTTQALSKPNIDANCEIEKVNIYPAFSTTRIAYRSETHQLTYFSNHQWAVMPDDILTKVLEHYLQHHRLFSHSATRFWKINPEYRLETIVYQLEAVQQNKTLAAHLNIEFRLIDDLTKDEVLIHHADRFHPLDKNDMNLFASAISQIYFDELNNLSNKIKQGLVTP
ncbi:MAG: ABC-type transport auxiliary lipoprotein family protein [Candidatus Cyclobacteriaceae bacterium M3_2C_046]